MMRLQKHAASAKQVHPARCGPEVTRWVLQCHLPTICLTVVGEKCTNVIAKAVHRQSPMSPLVWSRC